MAGADATRPAARPAGALRKTRQAFRVIAFAGGFAVALASERADWETKMQPITPLGYVVRHTASPISVDGKLDDAAWATAPWTSEFVDIEGPAKPKPRFRTRAKMLWDEDHLYLAAELEEPQVWATLTAHDSVIFQDPDFEVFIDPDGDTHAYSEFEINALATTWDLLLEKPYQDGGPPRNEWEIPGTKAAVVVHGTLNDASDTDRGWTIELAFPWRAFAAHARHAGAPTEGEQWRLNFSRVEWRITSAGRACQKVPEVPEDNWVWSPQGVIDMHRPEMWGVIQFTRRPPDDAVAVAPIPAKDARDRLLDVYYRQRDYFATNGRWATTLEEIVPASDALASQAGTEQPALTPTPDGYDCHVVASDGARRIIWTIRQDRRLSSQLTDAASPRPQSTQAH